MALTPQDWLQFFLQFLLLSLLAVGGAISTVPDMHRFLVAQKGWITDAQFVSSVALAQAAPGPNLLFVALFGWSVGTNAMGAEGLWSSAAGWQPWVAAGGMLGVVVALTAILLPSSTLTYMATRWAERHRNHRGVRAFKLGLAPVVVGLMLSTSWVLVSAHPDPSPDTGLWAITAMTTLVVLRTRIHLLWLLGAGAALGASGWL